MASELQDLVDKALDEERAQPQRTDDHHDTPAADELAGSPHGLEAARMLAGSADPLERSVAAHVLGSVVDGNPRHAVEVAEVLERMLTDADDPHLEFSIADALRLVWNARALEPLVRLAGSRSANVRRTVAEGVGAAMADEVTPAGVNALIGLSADRDARVRDWATFALGQLDLDTPSVRDALWARIDDPDDDTRAEALIGLAHRNDPRVVERVADELRRESVGKLAVEAAELLADPVLLEPLLAIEPWWDVDRDLLQRAIAASRVPKQGPPAP